MKTKKTIYIFIILIIIGCLFLLVGNKNNSNAEEVDLYYVNMKDDFEFEKNTKYFIDSSHIEIVGDYFYSKTTGGKGRTKEYYYNAKITNKYNQEYYIILKLNSGARTNMLNGNLKDESGVVYEVNSKIKDKQIESLGYKGKYADVYSIYLGMSSDTGLQLIGVSCIATGIICMIIVGVQSKKHKNNN